MTLLPTRNSITRVIFIVRFPTYIVTKSYVLLVISYHAIGCRKSPFLKKIVDLNDCLVKKFFGNKQNITFVSMTDDVYHTRA